MMLIYVLYFFLLLILPKVPTIGAAVPAYTTNAVPAYTATNFILLNCGVSSNINDTSGRTWARDESSRYSASKIISMHPSVLQVPYETATFFLSPFTHTFSNLSTGSNFLRLYFHPGIYSNFDTSQSFFSVTANAYTLLSNFSAFLYSRNSSQPSFMKEFVINIEENQRLDLTFSPNPNSFAFINGIEIVSIPDKLYFRGNGVPIKFVDQLFYLNNKTAFENLYRLTMGGARVEIQDDSGRRGMFRAWSEDYKYIISSSYAPHAENLQINYTVQTPPYSAPAIVYTTSRALSNSSPSMDWEFPVDSGFHYLLRLHFCEIQLEVTRQNERVFTISINNQTAEFLADVIYWAGGNEIPIFKDYITWVPDDGHRGKQDLRLSLFPNMEGNPRYASALLNGLEIFKLNDSNRSLAAATTEIVMDVKPMGKKGSPGTSVIYAVIGSVVGVLVVVSAVSYLISQRWRGVNDSATMPAAKSSGVFLSTTSRSTKGTTGLGVSPPSDFCRYFLLDDIKAATHNFDDNFVIGKGGFGNVYKGLIDDGTTAVAIKRLNPLSKQGAHEFLTEIEILSKLRHLHLVSLIGYCDEYGEMILVYDYMVHGTLRSHLYNSETSSLTWKQRLQICLGAAKGLYYLHTGTKNTIIHRDVKSSNILLDEKWVAKMSDFGLSKVGPSGESNTHVSTIVKGSLGYMDPEYYRRQKLTDKSDVYSFGVVLFEVLCARPAIIPGLPREQVNLAEWAKFCSKEGRIGQIIDSNLKGQIASECLSKFAETAVACLGDKGIERPAIRDVVLSLELAVHLQEDAESRGLRVTDSDGNSFTGQNVGCELSNLQHDQ